jgi:hypothetical protein
VDASSSLSPSPHGIVDYVHEIVQERRQEENQVGGWSD